MACTACDYKPRKSDACQPARPTQSERNPARDAGGSPRGRPAPEGDPADLGKLVETALRTARAMPDEGETPMHAENPVLTYRGWKHQSKCGEREPAVLRLAKIPTLGVEPWTSRSQVRMRGTEAKRASVLHLGSGGRTRLSPRAAGRGKPLASGLLEWNSCAGSVRGSGGFAWPDLAPRALSLV
jgi:hypothetical protein